MSISNPKRLAAVAALVSLCVLTVQAADPRSAAEVYRDYCAVCHSGGWQGAPIANDAGDWKTRLDTGFDAMFANAKNGLNGMPAMGTCMDCTDDELKGAIREMLPQ